MNENKDTEVSIDDFRRWTVPVLQKFLRIRNLRTSGRKEELVALAFSATAMNILPVMTKDEEAKTKALQYADKLTTTEGILPDPVVDLEEGWLSESKGIEKWPPTMYHDISNFLTCSYQANKSLNDRLMKDYKEGKAYSYFSSGWLKEVFYHEINSSSTFCFLKAECTPSQRISDIPHRCWVCINKQNGEIHSAYCTCFAGLGETCNHVAALLFKVDYAWQWGVNRKTCTSKPCLWNAPSGKKMMVEPKRLSAMQIMKPHYSKGIMKQPINPVSKQLFRPTKGSRPTLTNLHNALSAACPSAAVFQYFNIDLEAPSFNPSADINVLKTETVETSEVIALPKNLPNLAEQCQTVPELLQKLNLTKREQEVITSATLGQSSNSEWMSQRLGRITSSNMHSVYTKMNSIEKCSTQSDTQSILSALLGYKKVPENIPSLKYGRAMESVARNRYINVMKLQKHQMFSVKETGLHVKRFLGASPDGMVNCSCCGSGVLEIKCPISIAHTTPNADNLPYLHRKESDVKLNSNSSYYFQIQGHMAITDTQWCDFFIYTKHGHYLERILFDHEFWTNVQSKLETFFVSYVATELLSKKVKMKMEQDGGISKNAVRRKILTAKKTTKLE